MNYTEYGEAQATPLAVRMGPMGLIPMPMSSVPARPLVSMGGSAADDSDPYGTTMTYAHVGDNAHRFTVTGHKLLPDNGNDYFVDPLGVPSPADDGRPIVNMSYSRQISNSVNAIGRFGVGAVELVGAGVYNDGVRITGGLASIPYAFHSVQSATGVQAAWQERWGYNLRSDYGQESGRGPGNRRFFKQVKHGEN
jgi:hypothetical protein